MPQIFAFVRTHGRLLIDRSFYKIQRGVGLSRSIWNKVIEEMDMGGVRNPNGGFTLKRLSREKLVETLRGDYKALYLFYMSHVLDDEDFWSHRKWSRMFLKNNTANMFSKVREIIGYS